MTLDDFELLQVRISREIISRDLADLGGNNRQRMKIATEL